MHDDDITKNIWHAKEALRGNMKGCNIYIYIYGAWYDAWTVDEGMSRVLAPQPAPKHSSYLHQRPMHRLKNIYVIMRCDLYPNLICDGAL